jgi:uncharacterized surface protein with fasciclin (FAS1) repeats
MKTVRILAVVAMLAMTVALPLAQAQEHPTKTDHSKKTQMPGKAEMPQMKDVAGKAKGLIGAAAKAGNLSTFLAAVKAAGLRDKLASEGPFTVFAPTDEAFAKLPDGALDDLLKPANKSKLAGILANHVVPGKLMAADVKTMKATNVSGQDLAIEVHDGAVMVDGARVVQADLAADNGVIHTIDTVIMPKGDTGPQSDKPKDHPAH